MRAITTTTLLLAAALGAGSSAVPATASGSAAIRAASAPSALLAAAFVSMQDEGAAGSDASSDVEADDKADAKTDKPDRHLAIVGGTVHTVSGGVLRNVRIVTRNGRIEAIGPHVPIPDGAEVIDATGHHVYPGLVAVRSVGLLGGESPQDSTDVFSLQLSTALAGGITTAVSGTGAYKLVFGELDDMVVGEGLFVSLNYSTTNPSDRRRTRDLFERLRQHQRDVAEFERAKARNDPDAKEPDARWIRGRAAELQRLLKREATALATANREHDLRQLLELAETFGISIVVVGAHEGWLVAPEMARAGMRAIVTPRQRVDRDERFNRPNGSSIENARVLHAHGVPVAIIPSSPSIGFGGLGGRDLLHLRLEAAFAVRGGLSNQAALRAITLDAARVLGVDDRVGSIEVGKDADFVIADGDILHYATHARWTIVNGKVMYDKQKDTLFDHIRPDGDQDAPPPDDHWPRRLGQPW